jgi:hypothetical protein
MGKGKKRMDKVESEALIKIVCQCGHAYNDHSLVNRVCDKCQCKKYIPAPSPEIPPEKARELLAEWIYEHDGNVSAWYWRDSPQRPRYFKLADELIPKLQQAGWGNVAEIKRIAMKEENEIEQILGRVLGCPWYKDDLKNFPNATEANGVCVGDNVPISLAIQAANRIIKQEARIKELQDTCKQWERTQKI